MTTRPRYTLVGYTGGTKSWLINLCSAEGHSASALRPGSHGAAATRYAIGRAPSSAAEAARGSIAVAQAKAFASEVASGP